MNKKKTGVEKMVKFKFMTVRFTTSDLCFDGKKLDGMYYPNSRLVVVDCKKSILNKIETIVHEIIHGIFDKLIEDIETYNRFDVLIDKIYDLVPWRICRDDA